MAEKETLTICGQTIVLDPDMLRFSEASLSEYIQTEAAYVDNIGYFLSLAEKDLQNKQVYCDKIYSERYAEFKEGGTDKWAEAKAKSDADFLLAKNEVVEAQYVVKRLHRHLGAWDLSHDNAKSLGYRLCKEMDKLNSEIYARSHGFDAPGPDIQGAIERTITQVDPNTDLPSDLEIENL